ncbi:MAG: hypothetical protein M1817_002535 [Caeruleum heppii]|nr:MAG: hypothetical protein M1817_002535 [Caeruleum heppii]
MATNAPATTPERTVSTRLLIISDTHTRTPAPQENGGQAYRLPLPEADVLLHAGDITMIGRPKEYQTMIDVLKAADAELKIVIAGNHDITLDREFYTQYGKMTDPFSKHEDGHVDRAKEMWTGQEAKRAGISYVEEGTHTFSLQSGARFTIYTSPYQPEFMQWAFKYEHDEDRFNTSPPGTAFRAANPVPSYPQIDLMMTHGPPYQILDSTTRGEAVGCPHLLKAVERARPRLHCFGHIHEAWGAERVRWAKRNDLSGPVVDSELHKMVEDVHPVKPDPAKALIDRAVKVDIGNRSSQPLRYGEETLFVNAAIMNVRYMPVNAPWLVDLELPRSTEAIDKGVQTSSL